jgi:glycosyltransferase involved in cell wall biosynthesis
MAHRNPRVAILVENLPVPLDRRVWLEATTLRRAGWDVVVIGPRGRSEMRSLKETLDGISVLRYPQREASGLAGYFVEYIPSMLFTFAWLMWARARGPIDVIHGCNPPDLFWILGRVGRAWGARYVYDEHDPNPELSLTKFGSASLTSRLVHRLTIALEARSFRTADLVLTVNETCRDTIAQRSGRPASEILVLRNAPEIATVQQLAKGLEPEGRRIGYVGVMGTHDGLDVLANAWALLKEEPDMADAMLELVGDGPARAPTERYVHDAGLMGSVRFHGFLRPDSYVPIIARCLVGVSPDLPTPFNNLSSMVKIIDYMAINRGCISFDLAESRRLGGDSLVVARPADASGLASAMLQILRDPDRARRLGDAGRVQLSSLQLDWEPYGQALVSAYASLMA